jgi:hypothetical protein
MEESEMGRPGEPAKSTSGAFDARAMGERDAGLLALPYEVLIIILGELDAIDCSHIACVSRHLPVACADEGIWALYHERRWRRPRGLVIPRVESRSDYVRRHKQDAEAARCVGALLNQNTRAPAWKRLLQLGDEVIERVAELERDRTLRKDLGREAGLALVAINQSAGMRDWRALVRRAKAASRSRSEPPALEEGALVLVRLYQSREQLRRPHVHAEDEVCAQIDSLASRLASRLSELDSADAVAAVRELSALLFTEEVSKGPGESPGDAKGGRWPRNVRRPGADARAPSAPPSRHPDLHQTSSLHLSTAPTSSDPLPAQGFSGNSADYYNAGNSLLDQLLETRKGIPISLSVLFAAVCGRVGVGLDAIGLPGHFLLATRPQPPHNERVFVDAFHGGALLDLAHCQEIVHSYGHRWSPEFAEPVPPTEVWGRMLRNLMNCHAQAHAGSFDPAKASMIERLLAHTNDILRDRPRATEEEEEEEEEEEARRHDEDAIRHPSSEPKRSSTESSQSHGIAGMPSDLSHEQQRQLMHMLQLLQLRMAAGGGEESG